MSREGSSKVASESELRTSLRRSSTLTLGHFQGLGFRVHFQAGSYRYRSLVEGLCTLAL